MYENERVYSFFDLINDIITRKKYSYSGADGTHEHLKSEIDERIKCTR